MADLRPVYVAGDGDVKGPTSSSNNFLPLFADTTGKLLKSSGTGVTTQGLAILDDNTPAEQRNTIGLDQVNNTSDINKPVSTPQQKSLDLKANKIDLDQVNNTSDINKPVSTAQQTALNLKMNKTGDGATPTFGSVCVNSGGLATSLQGAYLFWNREGTGRTALENNPGDGVGGFVFRNVNKNNTAETGRVTIEGNGSLSSTGNITAAGSIYGANGAVAVETNGDVKGSVWGGWLSIYIANLLNTARINVASAATVNLTTSAPDTRNIAITGSINIAGVTVAAGRLYFVTFLGALTLKNSATLITQSNANIVTAVGDTCILRAISANVVEILCYTRGIPQAIGDGQTTQNMVGQRVVATNYTNTTGRPILLSVYTVPVAANILNLFVNGVVVAQNTINNAISGANSTLTWVILPGQVYWVTTTYGALAMWTEITV